MNQYEKIDNYIKQHGYITPLDAHKIGVTQFHARIKEMREKHGKNIESEWVEKPDRRESYKKFFYRKIDFTLQTKND